MAGKSVEPGEDKQQQRQDLGKRPSSSVDTYDPGGMAGKSVESGEESAADKQPDLDRSSQKPGQKNQNR